MRLLHFKTHPDQDTIVCWSNWAMMDMSVGETFRNYLSSSFAVVLEVEIRHIRIKGYTAAGDDLVR